MGARQAFIDGVFRHQDSNGGGGLITDGDTQWMTGEQGCHCGSVNGPLTCSDDRPGRSAATYSRRSIGSRERVRRPAPSIATSGTTSSATPRFSQGTAIG
jgi:hypothetical protein